MESKIDFIALKLLFRMDLFSGNELGAYSWCAWNKKLHSMGGLVMTSRIMMLGMQVWVVWAVEFRSGLVWSRLDWGIMVCMCMQLTNLIVWHLYAWKRVVQQVSMHMQSWTPCRLWNGGRYGNAVVLLGGIRYIVEEWHSYLHAIRRSVTNTSSTASIMQHLHLFSFSCLSFSKQALALLIGLGLNGQYPPQDWASPCAC